MVSGTAPTRTRRICVPITSSSPRCRFGLSNNAGPPSLTLVLSVARLAVSQLSVVRFQLLGSRLQGFSGRASEPGRTV